MMVEDEQVAACTAVHGGLEVVRRLHLQAGAQGAQPACTAQTAPIACIPPAQCMPRAGYELIACDRGHLAANQRQGGPRLIPSGAAEGPGSSAARSEVAASNHHSLLRGCWRQDAGAQGFGKQD
jgi:hypothetical protein